MSDEHAVVKAFPVVVAGRAPDAGKSAQSQVNDALKGPAETLTPPLPLGALSKLSEVNGTRKACIEAIALNTVGLGVEAVREAKDATTDAAEEAAAIVAELDKLSRRDTIAGSPSFVEQLRMVKTDEESCGWGFLEVSRNRTTGDVDGLYHVPAHRMRRLADRRGYVLVSRDGSADVEASFVNFGDRVDEQGEVTGGSNEVIVFRVYSPESRDYGMPRDSVLALEYAADKLAAESNVGFFDSSTVPPSILFLSGEQRKDGTNVTLTVPQETVDSVTEALKPGGSRQRTVAVVPLPAGSKVDHVMLAKRSERDIGNDVFRENVRLRTRQAFRISPIFVAEEGGGRYDAEVQRALTLEQVFDPEQRKYEDHLTPLLQALGKDGWRLKFRRLAVEGDQARRDSADALALTAAITNRELRAAHGMGPLPEHESETDTERAALDGKMPKGWNDKLVTSPKAPQQPFGGANDGSPFPRPDGRGLQAGLGGRPRQRATAEDPQQGSAAVAKGEGSPFVDDAAADLEVALLTINDEGVTEAVRRVYSAADIVAGKVAEELDRRNGLTAEHVTGGA